MGSVPAPRCWHAAEVVVRSEQPPTSAELVVLEEARRRLRAIFEDELGRESPAQRAHREEGRARLARLQARIRRRQ